LHQQRAIYLKLEIENGADRKRKNALDVAAVQRDVGGSSAKRSVVALDIDLDGSLDLDTGIASSLRRWRHRASLQTIPARTGKSIAGK